MIKIKKICAAVMVLVLFCSAFSVSADGDNVGAPPEHIGSDGFFCENDGFYLSVDEETTAVTLTSKLNGKSWSTNPTAEEIESKSGSITEALSSQLEISYYDDKNDAYTMNNYKDSIAKKQFEIKALKNGFKVIYDIGRKEGRMIIPQVMTADRFDEIVAKMSEDGKRLTESNYSLLSLEKLPESEKSDTLKKYPLLKKQDLYVLRDITEKVKVRMDNFFKEAGYTGEMMDEDYADIGYEANEQEYAYFKISLEYLLTETGLRIKLPVSEIEYDKENFTINTVSVAKLFGSADEKSNGYIFVPDGSGALITLNSEYTKVFSMPLYSDDNAFANLRFSGYSLPAVLPVYGLKNGDSAFMAVVEEGASKALISADTSKGVLERNYVGCIYTVLDRENDSAVENEKNSMLVKSSAKLMESDIVTNYIILNGTEADYSGMARAYRDILFGDRKPKASDTVPFYLESVGAITKTKRILGMSIDVREALTTFEQGIEILEALKAAGADNIKYRLTGWQKGGMDNIAPKKVTVDGKMGSKGDLKKLIKYSAENGIEFFPDTDFTYVKRNKWFDGFSPMNDASRSLSGKLALKADYMYDTLSKFGSVQSYILNPVKAAKLAEKYKKSYSGYGNKAVSLGTLGSALNSDFNTKGAVTRPKAQKYVTDILSGFSADGYSVMVEQGNSYALPYATDVVSLPDDFSGYGIEACAVPFVQIVLSGRVNYCGEPVNLSEDYELSLLKAAENGAGLRYNLNYAPALTVKNTEYGYLYSTNYESWTEKAGTQYKELSEIHKKIGASFIYSHNWVAEDVSVTAYENGVKVYVNYGSEDYNADGITVSAKGYFVK